MNYFLMSFRFNKETPQDFGLIFVNGQFLRQSDNTVWAPCQLFDFGWGKENGFYKMPLGTFEELVQLVLCDEDSEDSYGAAAMISEVYPMELKLYLMDLLQQDNRLKDKKKLRKLNLFFIA